MTDNVCYFSLTPFQQKSVVLLQRRHDSSHSTMYHLTDKNITRFTVSRITPWKLWCSSQHIYLVARWRWSSLRPGHFTHVKEEHSYRLYKRLRVPQSPYGRWGQNNVCCSSESNSDSSVVRLLTQWVHFVLHRAPLGCETVECLYKYKYCRGI